MNREEKHASLLDLLAFVQAGRATVTVGGHPFLSINSGEKTVEVEADGAKEAGLRFSDLAKMQGGPSSLLKGSGWIAGTLSRLGWKLTLLAEGDRILSMGSGVSRFTGRISVNPLKLRKLLKVLR
jgi:hypothetical protein